MSHVIKFIGVWGGFGLGFFIAYSIFGFSDDYLIIKIIISIGGGAGGFLLADKIAGD